MKKFTFIMIIFLIFIFNKNYGFNKNWLIPISVIAIIVLIKKNDISNFFENQTKIAIGK